MQSQTNMQREKTNTKTTIEADIQWYAIRTFHNKAASICNKARLDNIEYYTPVRKIDTIYNGECHTETLMLMPTLLFLRTTPEWIANLRQFSGDNILPYCEPGTSRPQAIADSEMERFRFVASTAAKTLEWVEPETLASSDRVRITEGIFKGLEGYIRRVHGTKRFVVAIEGVAAIATTYIPKQYIEKLK